MRNILKIDCLVIKNTNSSKIICHVLIIAFFAKKSFWTLISKNTEYSLYDYPIWLTHTYLKSAKFFLSDDI